MLGNDLHRDVLAALDRARPDAVVDGLRDVLKRHCAAIENVRLLMADYQLTVLRQVQTDVQVPINHGGAGESFVTQVPVVNVRSDGETNMYLPVTVHGDRLGVLHITLATPVAEDELSRLRDLAMLVGYVLVATRGQTDFLARSARSRTLSLAGELQWQLLNSRSCHAPDYSLAGHLEPTDAFYADNFDWSQDDQTLAVSVTDALHPPGGTGLLSTLAVTAVRNARRADLPLKDQACLADQAVYAHHEGKSCVDALLMQIDLLTGRACVVKAGSPEVVLVRSGAIHQLGLTDQLPLGMFEGTEYVEQSLALTADDRLVILTDGVLEAVSPKGERYGDRGLLDILSSTIQQPASAVVRAITKDLIEHRERGELNDDAAVVCLDWKGAGDPELLTVSDTGLAAPGGKRRLHVVPPHDKY